MVYPPERFSPQLLEGENIYFTHIDNKKSALNGYKL